MKLAIALVVVMGLAAAGAATYVVLDNRDPVAADMLACVRDANLPLSRSTASLNLARRDALTGALRPVRRWDWGRTSGVMLVGPARDYAVLALWNVDTPVAGDRRRRSARLREPGPLSGRQLGGSVARPAGALRPQGRRLTIAQRAGLSGRRRRATRASTCGARRARRW